MYVRTNSTLIVCVAGFLMTDCAFLSRAQQPVSGAGVAVSSVIPDAPTPQIEVALAADPDSGSPVRADAESSTAGHRNRSGSRAFKRRRAKQLKFAELRATANGTGNPTPESRRTRSRAGASAHGGNRAFIQRHLPQRCRLSYSRREIQAPIPRRHRPVHLHASRRLSRALVRPTDRQCGLRLGPRRIRKTRRHRLRR